MLYRFLTATDRAQFQPLVISLTDAGSLGEKIQQLGVPVQTLGMKRGVPSPIGLLRLARRLKKARVDLVQTWLYHADLMGGLAARLAGVPVVWGVHHAGVDAQMKPMTRRVVKSCAALSDWLPERIVCCAEATREGHVRLGYAASKSVVIPNGFDLSQFKPDPGARLSVRQELGIGEDAILIGCFARFHPDKDHANFVTAAGRLHQALPNTHFVLCGREVVRENPTLWSWIEAAGIGNRVHLLGARQDMPRLTASLDIFSTSSRTEASPLVIGEAMACGIPCVVTAVGDSARMVGDSGEFVPPQDPQALASAWQRVIELGRERRSELGNAARSRIEQNFNLPAMVRQYEALYEAVAAKGLSRSRSLRPAQVPEKTSESTAPQDCASDEAPKVLLAATIARTVGGLMTGQPGYLRRAGFDVTVVSAPGPQLGSMADREGVSIAAIPMEREFSPGSDLVSLFRFLRLIRRLRPVITNVSTPKAGLIGGIAAWLGRVPCRLYTLRGLRLETTRGVKRLVLTAAEWLACRCAHRVICVSDSLRKRVVQLGLVKPEQAIVLGAGSSNGIDLSRFSDGASESGNMISRRSLGIPDGAPVIGFVGRLTRDKGIVELVEAFLILKARLPEIRLLIVGDYEPGDPVPEGTRVAIAEDPHILFVGLVPDTAPYYGSMDVLALPTHREGFPNVVLQASAFRKPIVAAASTGTVDAVVDGVTGLLVPVGDPVALAGSLTQVLEDPQLAARLGSAGRERVEREFACELVWRRQVNLYRHMLRERGVLISGSGDSVHS